MINFKFVVMKKLSMLLVFFVLLFSGCNNINKTAKEITQKDTLKPKAKISVIKEYDADGNLISIDSTYYSFYSNIKNDSLLEKEIFEKFKKDFDNQFKSLDSVFLSDFLKMNSFKTNEFYTKDYFRNQLDLNQKRIEKVFKEMDSLKNSYYDNSKKLIDK